LQDALKLCAENKQQEDLDSQTESLPSLRSCVQAPGL